MGLTFTLTDGVNSITIDKAVLGYKSTIRMAIDVGDKQGSRYSLWDNTSTYDAYFCDCRFALYNTQQADLIDLITNASKGRGSTLTMQLGASASGFFPFTPLKGDKGDFDVEVVKFQPLGLINQPVNYFENEFTFVAQSFPAYSFPTERGTGPLEFGNSVGVSQVSDITFPKSYPSLEYIYNLATSVTRDGSGSPVDYGEEGDKYDVSMSFDLLPEKAMRVLDFLINTARATDWTVIAPSSSYVFGYDKGSSGTYKVKLISPTIVVTHNGPLNFSFNVKLNYLGTL